MTDAVLITGCSSGIGRATATAFHDRGWDVYATARTPSDIDDLADRGMATLELDVTAEDHCAAAVDHVLAESGTIDCLVNNAGYSEIATVEDLDAETLHAQLDVNTYGPQRLMHAALPHMREAGAGTIVNMSSVGGKVAQPALGAYCASKFALEALSDSARAELRPFGVDVVLVEPGPVHTAFSDTAEAAIDDRLDEPGPYRALYERVGEYNAGIVDRHEGGLFPHLMRAITIRPTDVAAVVVAAAEANDPKPRYAPSAIHRLLAFGHLAPDRLRDRVFAALV